MFSCSFVVKVACDWGELCSFIFLLSELFVTVGSCVHLFQWGREERKMTSFDYFDM